MWWQLVFVSLCAFPTRKQGLWTVGWCCQRFEHCRFAPRFRPLRHCAPSTFRASASHSRRMGILSLTLENWKSYEGKHVIPLCTFTAIVGPNGAGACVWCRIVWCKSSFSFELCVAVEPGKGCVRVKTWARARTRYSWAWARISNTDATWWLILSERIIFQLTRSPTADFISPDSAHMPV